MQLNPSEISELIKTKIQNLDTGAEVRTQGTVVSVTDGICRIHGLSDAMAGEMLEFPQNTFGLALNLERDSVGAVILGAYEHITEGDTVKCTGRILSVPVGPELIGRVLIEGDRIGVLPQIQAMFEALKDSADGVAKATIETAFPFQGNELAELTSALEKRFGKKIEATVTVNHGLIGGARVTVGDTVIDASVQEQLRAMAVQLRA